MPSGFSRCVAVSGLKPCAHVSATLFFQAPDMVSHLWVPSGYIEAESERQRKELARRARLYRGDRPAPQITGRAVIVIDDGLATGSTMLAALQALDAQAPTLLIAAIPVAPPEAIRRLSDRADRVECLLSPRPFWAVGAFYVQFEQVSDEKVVELLTRASSVSTDE